MERIGSGQSPVVDGQWIEHMPKHAIAEMGEKIEHHHINGGRYATLLPKSLHRGSEFTKFNHWYRYAPTQAWRAANINTVGKATNIMTAALTVVDAYKIAIDHPFAMTNQIHDFDNAGVFAGGGAIVSNKLYSYFSEQGVFLINFMSITPDGEYKGTIYDSFAKDPSSGKWIGVGVVNQIQSGGYP